MLLLPRSVQMKLERASSRPQKRSPPEGSEMLARTERKRDERRGLDGLAGLVDDNRVELEGALHQVLRPGDRQRRADDFLRVENPRFHLPRCTSHCANEKQATTCNYY